MAKILVVDNSLFVYERIKSILDKRGDEVIGHAKNAQDAIDQYVKSKPDLVTMDLVMPKVGGKDGVAAIREIRHIDPQARILVVTAMVQQTILDDVLQLGAYDYVLKPLDDAVFLEKVQTGLHQQTQSPAS